ncbi:hypothetical protein EJP77_06100 [Paenibacillus zeisoli]|uniref:Uncharacterized protein n=1 Tax=Paenibacillus zeisoli TaxID=2496267 RepID=A0A433XGL7_9BACL|nr:hypothetical protein [Paenibacillus zeisoli]RUT33225.1 hypothetical protein EJP77_06100 [Paenibacillus zeisoli]
MSSLRDTLYVGAGPMGGALVLRVLLRAWSTLPAGFALDLCRARDGALVLLGLLRAWSALPAGFALDLRRAFGRCLGAAGAAPCLERSPCGIRFRFAQGPWAVLRRCWGCSVLGALSLRDSL